MLVQRFPRFRNEILKNIPIFVSNFRNVFRFGKIPLVDKSSIQRKKEEGTYTKYLALRYAEGKKRSPDAKVIRSQFTVLSSTM